MAERNDVNIKVGVTGAKKALDELTKVLDSYSKKEKAQQQLAHQAEVNQLKLKEMNSERLHKGRMLKEAERIKQVTNNAKIESLQLTNRLKMIQETAKTETMLSEQAAKSHRAKNSQIQSDLSLQHATQRAILETTTKTADAVARQEVATLRVAKAEEDVARAASRSQAATFSREAAEVRLQGAIDKTASQATQNALREQNLTEAINNTRIRGANLVASEERRQLKFTSDEERRIRQEALRERISNARLAAIAENQARARQREADRQADRASRNDRQQQGFFGGILSPAIGGMIETLGRASLAFMILGNAIRPVTDLVGQALTAFAQYQQTMQTLETVTRNTGISFQGATQVVNRFNDGISNRESVAAAVRNFSSMGLSLDRQSQLIDSIRDGIVAMGGDVNEQLPLMALAIKRNSSELLDNMGITKNVDEMYKEYAASIHKTVKELNQQEKDTAVINGVLQELQKYSGVAANSQQQLSGQMARLNTHIGEISVAFGGLISGPGATLIRWIDTAIVYWGRLGQAQEGAIDDLGRQLSDTTTRLQRRITGQETVHDLQMTLRAVNREINTQMQAGIRPDAPIMNALRERGRQVINAMRTIRNAELAAEKRRKQDAQAAAEARLKDDEVRQQILVAQGKQFQAEQMQAFINFEKNKKDMKLELAQQLFDAEMALAKQHEDERLARIAEAAERERKKNESEAAKSAKHAARSSKRASDAAAREAQKQRNAQLEKEYREGVARGAIASSKVRAPSFGVFRSTAFQAAEGATSAQQQKAALDSLLSSSTALGANQNQLAKLKEEMARTTVLPKSEIDRMKKQREELEKAIKDGQQDVAENQRKLDDVNYKIQQEKIQETANFLESAYQVAFNVIQGDWMAVAAQIGSTLKDSIIKNLSELDVFKDFTKGIKDQINKFMTELGAVDSFKLLGDGLVLYGMYKAVEIGNQIIQKFYDDVNKKIDEAKQLYEEPETVRQKKEKKIAELQSQKSDLQGKQFLAQLAYVATGFGSLDFGNQVKNNLENLTGSIEQTDYQMEKLRESFDTDLTDPMSKASIALKELTASVDRQQKVYESQEKTRNFLEDLKTKTTLNQIDIDEKAGKITKDEADKRRFAITMEGKTNEVISTLVESVRDQGLASFVEPYIRSYIKGMDISDFSAGTYSSWDDFFNKNSQWMRSMGRGNYTPDQLRALFDPLKTFLTSEAGANAPGNMPGSSPDKPMYTQVVNVRDFREAFPDSAYFRAPSVDTTRSLNANAVVYR